MKKAVCCSSVYIINTLLSDRQGPSESKKWKHNATSLYTNGEKCASRIRFMYKRLHCTCAFCAFAEILTPLKFTSAASSHQKWLPCCDRFRWSRHFVLLSTLSTRTNRCKAINKTNFCVSSYKLTAEERRNHSFQPQAFKRWCTPSFLTFWN